MTPAYFCGRIIGGKPYGATRTRAMTNPSMGYRNIRVAPEARCTFCGARVVDHTLLRYVLAAWVKHRAVQPLQWLAVVKRRRRTGA